MGTPWASEGSYAFSKTIGEHRENLLRKIKYAIERTGSRVAAVELIIAIERLAEHEKAVLAFACQAFACRCGKDRPKV